MRCWHVPADRGADGLPRLLVRQILPSWRGGRSPLPGRAASEQFTPRDDQPYRLLGMPCRHELRRRVGRRQAVPSWLLLRHRRDRDMQPLCGGRVPRQARPAWMYFLHQGRLLRAWHRQTHALPGWDLFQCARCDQQGGVLTRPCWVLGAAWQPTARAVPDHRLLLPRRDGRRAVRRL